MSHRLLVPAVLLSGFLAAAEPPPPAPSPAPAPAPAPVASSPDPTAAVVAEGRFIYRQRDLDALVLIAQRHAKNKLPKADEERLRQALIRCLTAREPLIGMLAELPPSIQGNARAALVLDLIDYQAEPALPPAAPPPNANVPPPTPPAPPTATAPPPTAAPPAATAPAAAGKEPVMVRLPVITRTRTLEGLGKRQLTLTLALYFRDPVLAQGLEAKAPLIQDAILGFLQTMPAAQFAEPDQLALKEGLTKAVIAKVPEFPADGILIPQLEAGAAETPAKAP